MEETLKIFLESISQRAAEEVRALKEEASAQREAALADFGHEAELRAADVRRRGIAEAESAGAQMIAARESKYRRTLLEYRQTCARETMERVLEKVKAYTALPEYPERLLALAEKGLQALGEPRKAELFLRREDMIHGEYIRLRLKDTDLTVREGDIFLGGLVVADPEKGLRADLSFDTAMADAEARFGEVSGLEIG